MSVLLKVAPSIGELNALVSAKLSVSQKLSYLRQFDFWRCPESSLERQRLQAEAIDRFLGFKIKEVESVLLKEAKSVHPTGDVSTLGRALHHDNQTWVGLGPRALQTPYSEFLRILQVLRPRPGDLVVDLGAAYGRLGVLLGLLYPQCRFLGLEFVPQRVQEGRRIFAQYRLAQSELRPQDLMSVNFELPKAQHYFIYDFGRNDHLKSWLYRLGEEAHRRSFHVVVRGKVACQAMKEQNLRRQISWAKETADCGIFKFADIASSRELR